MDDIFREEVDGVVMARDGVGTYYYLPDGLGMAAFGAWLDRRNALQALDEWSSCPPPDVPIDRCGVRVDVKQRELWEPVARGEP